MNFLNFFGKSDTGISQKEAEKLINLARSVKKGLSEGGTVSFSSMKSVPYARSPEDALVINDRINCFHLEINNPDLMIWDVHMKKNSQFGIHDHDAVEQVWVLSGECTVDGVVVRRFGTRKFGNGHKHNIRSENGCHLMVLFTEPTSLA